MKKKTPMDSGIYALLYMRLAWSTVLSGCEVCPFVACDVSANEVAASSRLTLPSEEATSDSLAKLPLSLPWA